MLKAYINITAEDGTLLDRIEVTPDDLYPDGRIGDHIIDTIQREVGTHFANNTN